jgi:anti-anti-sigma factor
MNFPSAPLIEAGGAVLRVSGDLDIASAPALAEAIEDQPDGVLCIDMRDVAFMDSAGAEVLVGAARSRGTAGCLIVHEPRPALARVFDPPGAARRPEPPRRDRRPGRRPRPPGIGWKQPTFPDVAVRQPTGHDLAECPYRRDGPMDRTDGRTSNLLLDSLPRVNRHALLSESATYPIELRHVFLEPGDEVERVLCPVSGTLSIIAEPGGDGRRVEAATVGREGVANVHAALGSRVAGQQLVGQVAGEAIGIDVEIFGKLVAEDDRLRVLVNGYVEAVFAQTVLSVACNALHHLTERCARWLLMTHDRVDTDEFELTHELLATMLGVTRPSMSVAAKTLQAAGLITYRRGRITVVDREGLEDAACPCYELIRSEYSRLVPITNHS